MTSESGAQRTLTVKESGNIFGEASFFDGLDRVSSASADTQCQIIAIDHALLTECFSREPELAVTMLRYLGRTVRMLSNQLDTVSFLPANRRIARVLLDYDEINPGLHGGRRGGMSRPITASPPKRRAQTRRPAPQTSDR